jgi:hypothetical protein
VHRFERILEAIDFTPLVNDVGWQQAVSNILVLSFAATIT